MSYFTIKRTAYQQIPDSIDLKFKNALRFHIRVTIKKKKKLNQKLQNHQSINENRIENLGVNIFICYTEIELKLEPNRTSLR